MFFSFHVKPVNLLIENLLHIRKSDEEIFLVGGIVRDLVLQRTIDDIDLVVIGSVRKITKRLADYMHSPFFILNEGFNAARIIWDIGDEKINIDLVEIRGDSIQADLMLRDFTINSLAINVLQLDQIIDPCGGLQDLQQHIIRCSSDLAFKTDPVRVLRAIRQSVKFKFRIETNTLNLLKEAIPDLNKVSIERVRDELFKVLNAVNPYQTLVIFNHLNILHPLFPEILKISNSPCFEEEKKIIWQHSLKVVQALTKILPFTLEDIDREKINDLYVGEIVLNFKRYRDQLAMYFKEYISGERNRIALLYLSSIFHDCGKFLILEKNAGLDHETISYANHEALGAELVENISKRYALSTKESDILKKIVRHHMILHLAVKNNQKIDSRWIYRFIKHNQQEGIMLIYLSLADTLAQIDQPGMVSRLFDEIKIGRMILDAYFGEDKRLREPPHYLNGHEIILLTGVKPGPVLGKLKSQLEEETAVNNIKSKAEAIDFIKTSYSN